MVADIGSGTGFLSEIFVRNGNEVFAVEPNAPMRAAAESLLGNSPGFHSIDATAEATGLENCSIDFITAGQAFHWFDPEPTRAEFQRILRPQGWIMLVWNERRADQGPFAAEYEKIVRAFRLDSASKTTIKEETRVLPEFFRPGSYRETSFLNSQALDLNGLIDRALSSSYLPLPGQPRSQEMVQRLREIFSAHSQDGEVRFDYQTMVFYGRLA